MRQRVTQTRYLFSHRFRLTSLSFLAVALVVTRVFAQEQPRALELNAPVERELAGGQAHVYSLRVAAKQAVRIVAQQKGVDLILSVIAPDGTKLFEVDSPNGATGDEPATFATQQGGTYRIEVRALDEKAPVGQYAIRLDRFLTETEYATEHLAALGRLWGMVKYFHPYLAYKNIDWDGALVKTIPQVKAARTPNEYRQAISGLLQVLNDPATSVVAVTGNGGSAQISQVESLFISNKAEQSLGSAFGVTSGVPEAIQTSPKDPKDLTYFRVVDGYLVILASDWATSMVNNPTAFNKLNEMLPELKKAKGVVLDCRYQGVNLSPGDNGSFYLNFYLGNILPRLVQGSVSLGTIRYRIHNGYAPQRGNTSGDYISAFVTESPGAIIGTADEQKALAIVVDERTPDLVATLSGLQTTGAKIIQVGEGARGLGVRSHQMMLPDGVRVTVRTAEFVSPNGGSSFTADLKLPGGPADDQGVVAKAIDTLKSSNTQVAANHSANQTSTTQATAQATSVAATPAATMISGKDNPYPSMSFPAQEYRLFALFRFWNVINYHFPYKHLTDKPWDTVLTDFVPRFLENKNQLDYEMTVAEMVARLQDTHGFVRPLNLLDEHLGGFAPPLFLRVAGGKMVVESLADEKIAQAAGIKVGDIVLRVDGETVEQRIAYLAKFKSFSSIASRYRYIDPTILRGAKDSVAKLSIQGSDGATREVQIPRSVAWTSVAFPQPRKTPMYAVLPSGYGYIDLARLPGNESQKAMSTVMNTPALIFDMRGYPNGTAWSIGPQLSEKQNFTVAQFRRPFRTAFTIDGGEDGGVPNYSFEQKMPPRSGPAYKGKVVMLINEDAISQAEHTCLFFEAAANATFIGTTTDGANGDVTNLVLPGAIYVSFSGHDVRHADGRQLQRVGIQPHVKIEPTAQGIREGRDEVLEAAVKYLESVIKK